MTKGSTGFLHVQDEQITVLDLEYYAGVLCHDPDNSFMIYLGSHLTEKECTTVAMELIGRYLNALSLGWQDRTFKLYVLSPSPDEMKRSYFFGGSRNHARKPARIIG